MKSKSPLRWVGGKGNMLQHILKELNVPHFVYAEPFYGGGHVILNKPVSPSETINDINDDLFNFFMVLSDPVKFALFYRQIKCMPFSRRLYKIADKKYEKGLKNVKSDVLRAMYFFINARQSFGGDLRSKGWGYTRHTTTNGYTQSCASWINTLERLPEVHQRLQKVQIENTDFRVFMKNFDDGQDTLFYCDPPYIVETVKEKKGQYKNNLSNDDHKEFIDIVLSSKAKFVISGYEHEIYEPLVKHGFTLKKIVTSTHLKGRTRKDKGIGEGAIKETSKAVECIWISPNINHQRKLL